MLTLTPEQRSNKVTVADWLISYRDSESRKKRGAKQEVLRINRFLQRPFAALKIGQITYKDLQKYFDERLKNRRKNTLEPWRRLQRTKKFKRFRLLLIWP